MRNVAGNFGMGIIRHQLTDMTHGRVIPRGEINPGSLPEHQIGTGSGDRRGQSAGGTANGDAIRCQAKAQRQGLAQSLPLRLGGTARDFSERKPLFHLALPAWNEGHFSRVFPVIIHIEKPEPRMLKSYLVY
jgi:hypothetical protein